MEEPLQERLRMCLSQARHRSSWPRSRSSVFEGSARELTVQPRPGELPVAINCGRRDAKEPGRALDWGATAEAAGRAVAGVGHKSAAFTGPKRRGRRVSTREARS